MENTEEVLKHCKQCLKAERPSSAYNYVCLLCSQHNNKRNDMRRHMRKHTGEKPYKCSYCGYMTSQRGALNVHIKIKHHIF